MNQIKRNIYSVGQVNTYIKNMFAQDFFLQRICVQGEVSNCKYHTSGHIYFTLKDADGAINCIMFAGNRKGLTFPMKDGDQVVVTGSTISECTENYIKKLKENGITISVDIDNIEDHPSGGETENPVETKTLKGVIEDIRTAVIDGNSYYYIKLEDSKSYFVFKAGDNESVVILSVGDKVKIEAEETAGSIVQAKSIEKTK